jgi:hypothetical protein
VWGTVRDADNIVWGTMCGGEDCGDNIVWGTVREVDNIVWGTAADLADNIVWGTSGEVDNIVWGTTSDDDGMSWGSSDDEAPPLFEDPNAAPANFDSTAFDSLFGPESTTAVNNTEPVGTAVTNSIFTALSGSMGGL